MKKKIHPETQKVEVSCLNCKSKLEVLTTQKAIKVEVCSNCHPFYTGKQTIMDTANKVKDFERRKTAATSLIKSKKGRKNTKIKEIKGEKLLTLRDMLKAIQN